MNPIPRLSQKRSTCKLTSQPVTWYRWLLPSVSGIGDVRVHVQYCSNEDACFAAGRMSEGPLQASVNHGA
jgi:hypothetical protein